MSAKLQLRADSHKRALIAFLLPLLSACIVLPEMTDELLLDWKKHVNQARALMVKKDFAGSEREYKTAIQKIDRDKTLQIFVALTRREQGLLFLEEKQDDRAALEFADAAAIFLSERKRDSDTYSIYTRQHFDSLFQLALLEKKAGKKQDAIKHLHEALWADSSSEKSEQCKDQLLMLEDASGQQELSEEVLVKVREMSLRSTTNKIKVEPVLAEVDELCRKGEFKKANSYLEALLELSKRRKETSPQAAVTFALIKMKYQLVELDAAEKLCRTALELCRTNEAFANLQTSYLAALSLVLNRKNEGDEANNFFSQAQHAAETDKLKQKLARVFEVFALIDQESGHLDQADQALGKAVICLLPLPDKPDYARIEIEYGSVLLDKNHLKEARAYLLKGLEKANTEPDKFMGNLCLARYFLQKEHPQQAIRYAESASKYAQDALSRTQAGLALAKCAYQRKDFARAQKELSSASAELGEAKSNFSPKAVQALEAECRELKEEIELR